MSTATAATIGGYALAITIVVGLGLMIHSCTTTETALRRECMSKGGTVISSGGSSSHCVMGGGSVVKP